MNKKEICDLLQLLNKLSPGIRISTKCIYADGMGKTYILIDIYCCSSLKGEIIYRQETGKVKEGFYKNLILENGSYILDVLLDIYNLEKKL